MQEELNSKQLELFTPLTRTERQKEAVREWIRHKCHGTWEFCTGFGKTFTSLMAIKVLLKKFPQLNIIVVVPSETLKEQWINKLDKEGLSLNSEVIIINSAIKENRSCDLLIIDEIHRTPTDSFQCIYNIIKYKYILGLTATLERLDGKHELIEKYCPVIDKITAIEAVANGWMAESVEYKVILNVSDIDKYKELSSNFNKHFEYFGYDFNLILSLVGKNGYKHRLALREAMCKANSSLDRKETLQNITLHAMEAMRLIQERKKFINEHPDKIRLTQEIIKHRPDAKIITFSATIDIAEKIGIGYVYSSRQSKKKNKLTVEEFSKIQSGVLNSSKKADEGLDIPGINTLILLGQDSSPTRWTQRLGRATRYEGNKIAEVFTFVIDETTENEWYKNSHKDSKFIPISEEGLIHVLKGEPYEQYKKPIKQFKFRF